MISALLRMSSSSPSLPIVIGARDPGRCHFFDASTSVAAVASIPLAQRVASPRSYAGLMTEDDLRRAGVTFRMIMEAEDK